MPSRSWIGRLRVAAVGACLAAVAVGGAAFSGGSRGYVVQPGDDLWRIAGRSGTTVAALAAANDMRPSDVLRIGRHLVIPSGTARASATQLRSASSVTPATRAATAAGKAVSSSAYGGAGAPVGVVRSTFCAGFTPDAGPSRLPAKLSSTPSRLALRPLFAKWAAHYGVRASLLEAIAWQESGWQQDVVSVDGAVGIGQVMPATAAFVTSTLEPITLSLTAESDNIRLEAAYVAYLAHHTGTTCDTIASYYEGLTNLARSGVLSMSVSYIENVEYLIPGFS
ncbi:MAG TPA: transglycosylase SLT domain-containing protein [Acidimicrobiales bacterium]|nr:transglycosylase SLT domain-containing protein [Acidimicrobiales bacterium]